MSSSGRALGIIGAVLTGFLTLFLLALAIFNGEFAVGLGEIMAEAASDGLGRTILTGAAVALFAGEVLLIMRAMGFGGAQTIEFENDAGRMVVDVSALEECLKRTAIEDPDATDASCSIMIPRGGIDQPITCSVDVGILERADIPGKGADLSSRLRRRFLQIIPLASDPVINLRIRIRAPKHVSPVTAALTPAAGLEAVKPPEEEEKKEPGPKPLPDVPEFTGERRYGVQEDEESAS